MSEKRCSGSRCSSAPAFAGLPVLWMVSSSFKSNLEIFAYPPALIDHSFSFDAYLAVLSDPGQLRFFFNSYLVAILVTICTVITSIMAGYSFEPLRLSLQASPEPGHHRRPVSAAHHADDPLLRPDRLAENLQYLYGAGVDLHGVHAVLRHHHDDRLFQHAPARSGRSRHDRRAAAAS